MNQVVTDNTAERRFELPLDGNQLAFVDYLRRGDVIIMTHAEVPSALQGRGIGARLVGGALDIVRARGEKVVPQCPYVAVFIRRHPAYQALLA